MGLRQQWAVVVSAHDDYLRAEGDVVYVAGYASPSIPSSVTTFAARVDTADKRRMELVDALDIFRAMLMESPPY